MTTIYWTGEYAINIEKIDFQHKTLAENINYLYDAFLKNSGYNELSPILERLSLYAKDHYRTEEIYMISYGYKDIDIHRLEHSTFIRQVDLFKNRYKDGKVTMTIEFIMYMKQWLLKHIVSSDKDLGTYLKKYEIK